MFKSVYIYMCVFILAPKPVGRRARKPGIDRKPRYHERLIEFLNTLMNGFYHMCCRQAYSAKQLERLENEFKVSTQWDIISILFWLRHKIFYSYLYKIQMLLYKREQISLSCRYYANNSMGSTWYFYKKIVLFLPDMGSLVWCVVIA